jgi:hypothetical protein
MKRSILNMRITTGLDEETLESIMYPYLTLKRLKT